MHQVVNFLRDALAFEVIGSGSASGFAEDSGWGAIDLNALLLSHFVGTDIPGTPSAMTRLREGCM